jgi:hypothetical protein
MRKYSKTEQKFLKLIDKVSDGDLEFFSYYLQNEYFTSQRNTALFIIPPKQEALLFIKKDAFDDLALRKKELKHFLEIISLCEFLKQNRYIDIIPSNHVQKIPLHIMHKDFDDVKQTNQTSNITLNQNGLHLKTPDLSKIYDSQNNVVYEAVLLEKHTYNLLIDNFMGLLFVSEELKDFIKSDFKSKSDIRYKYGQFATWTSILIALTFGVIGTYSGKSKNTVETIKIDSNQLKEILDSNDSLKCEITELKKINQADVNETGENKVLPTTKNIVHLADSAKNEVGVNK